MQSMLQIPLEQECEQWTSLLLMDALIRYLYSN